ncbi:hypothetical protein [Arthrobacter bambusae]|nr:hypothetical protein [Arthrobacter bambusae]MDQ0029695.1 hypothetical protein [Arthrobacter bambusae]MDQ0097356.1 hypothetical protein [Arthrobacter bambusae]
MAELYAGWCGKEGEIPESAGMTLAGNLRETAGNAVGGVRQMKDFDKD